jgi:hypothetical protein
MGEDTMGCVWKGITGTCWGEYCKGGWGVNTAIVFK